jgi:hypothetical protein
MSQATIVMLSPQGLPFMCEICGEPATGSYVNTLGRIVLCCTADNLYVIKMRGDDGGGCPACGRSPHP